MPDKPINIKTNELKTATELNLDINNSHVGITSPCLPGTKISYGFENGDDVVLEKGGIRIRMRGAIRQPNGSIIGTVQSVEPDQALVSLGVDDNTSIQFSGKHIFTCSKK